MVRLSASLAQFRNNRSKFIISGCGAVGSAPALGAGGRTFKSCHPDHSKLR